MNVRTTKLKIESQGCVFLAHKYAYDVIGNEEFVGFYFDIVGLAAQVEGSISCAKLPPSIFLVRNPFNENEESTEVSFPEFIGWDVHSYHSGKTISIALRKENL